MKVIIGIMFFLLASSLNVAWGQEKGKGKEQHSASLVRQADTSEYELIVFDPGFESWLLTQPSASFRSQRYYESRNRQYVVEWNYRYSHPLLYGFIYDSYIDYDFFENYGLELNYKLYQYFRYFEEKNRVKLTQAGRES